MPFRLDLLVFPKFSRESTLLELYLLRVGKKGGITSEPVLHGNNFLGVIWQKKGGESRGAEVETLGTHERWGGEGTGSNLCGEGAFTLKKPRI